MKTVSRNKLLHCFRPMVDMDVVNIEPKTVTGRSADQPGFKYLTAENHVTNNHVKVAGTGFPMNPKIVRQPARRTFSHVVKAVFFKTILSKIVRDKKGVSKERPSLDLSNSSIDHHEQTISVPENGNIVQICSSSSSSSSSTLESLISTKTLKSETVKKRKRHITNGIYLVFISLVMTVLWGKLCAIILTSSWLYFLRLPYPDNCWQGNVIKLPETDQSMDHVRKIDGYSTT